MLIESIVNVCLFDMNIKQKLARKRAKERAKKKSDTVLNYL